MKRLIISMLLLLPALCMADVYKWVDADGNVHYGDRAQPADKAVKIPEFNYKSPRPTQAREEREDDAADAAASTAEREFPVDNYRVRITAPLQDATVRDNQGIVPVSLETDPALQPEHAYQMYLDGSPWYEPFASQRVLLSNVERGAHTIQVRVVTAEGLVLGLSNSVTFYLFRETTDAAPVEVDPDDPYKPDTSPQPYNPKPADKPYQPVPDANPYTPTPGKNPYTPTPSTNPYKPTPAKNPYSPG